MIGWIANPWRDMDDPKRGLRVEWGGDLYEVKPGVHAYSWDFAQHATGKLPAMRLACFNTEQEAQAYLDLISKEG